MKLVSDGKPLKLKDGRYRLIEDWQFLWGEGENPLIVPKGYVCDLASIPKWAFWWKRGLWDIAAIAHDHICDYGYIYLLVEGEYTKYPLSRKAGDWLFYKINLAMGVKPKTAFLMYKAVRFWSIKCGLEKIFLGKVIAED